MYHVVENTTESSSIFDINNGLLKNCSSTEGGEVSIISDTDSGYIDTDLEVCKV